MKHGENSTSESEGTNSGGTWATRTSDNWQLKTCCCLVAQLCPTLCDPMDYIMPGFLVLHYLPEFVQTHFHWVNDAIQPSHPLPPLLLLPSVFPSIMVFSIELALHIRWPKYWSFIFSINPSKEYWQLISFRIDWFDLLAVHPRVSQESSTAPQFKSIKSSALSFLHDPPLTTVHDYWKNHSFDYMDFCQQHDVSAF